MPSSVVEPGNPGGNLLLGEPIELDNSDLLAKLQRHDLHRLIATVRLDDHPAAMDASFAAPVRVRYEVRAKLLARSKRSESGVVLTFFVAQLEHISRHRLPFSEMSATESVRRQPLDRVSRRARVHLAKYTGSHTDAIFFARCSHTDQAERRGRAP